MGENTSFDNEYADYAGSSDIVVSGLSGFGEHGSIFPSASEAPQILAKCRSYLCFLPNISQ